MDRLADADLLFHEGAPPEAKYRFKHALIQDAAYESQLKSRRQALHSRAAEILRDNAERAAAEPEVIAHHFTEAGLGDQAIEWWGQGGRSGSPPLCGVPGGDRSSRQGDRHGGQGGEDRVYSR